jgi:hypothetical protein
LGERDSMFFMSMEGLYAWCNALWVGRCRCCNVWREVR